jgi:hypothetical protein
MLKRITIRWAVFKMFLALAIFGLAVNAVGFVYLIYATAKLLIGD